MLLRIITTLIIALGPILAILMASEFLWKKKLLRGEFARKFIHILAGSWMAFWSLYIPADGIVVLGVLALVMVVYSRSARLFHAVYAVKRRSIGDVFLAIAIIVCALYSQESWVYTVSILTIAVADGGAALAGKAWGGNTGYRFLGFRPLKKSIHGTVAFMFLMYAVLCVGALLGGASTIGESVFKTLIILPVGAALFENASPWGLDNLISPVFVMLLLNTVV